MELLQIATAKFIIKCDGKLFCYKVRQREVVTRILIFSGRHDLPTDLTDASLRSRRFEVVGERENGRA